MSALYRKLAEKILDRENVVERILQGEDRTFFASKPFITVCRDPGSGGKPIAKMVAKKLGFKFYDDDLIHEIAKSVKARDEVLKGVDEKQRSMMEDLVHSILNPDYVSERRYITHLCRVVLKLAQKGGVVILGRGSNFITPNAYGLQVRITAPYRVCVARAVQYEKVPHKKAREIISKVTEERAAFVKQYFGKDIMNPKYYDINLNTTYMTMEEASDIIIYTFKKKFPRGKASKY